MKCEEFLFEGAYECGETVRLGKDALDHLRTCASCRAQFHNLRNGINAGNSESVALTSQRLHDAIAMAIVGESARFSPHASFGRAWLQLTLALLVLVGSMVGIAYQDHPSEVTPLYSRR
jgi:hypothetical protein